MEATFRHVTIIVFILLILQFIYRLVWESPCIQNKKNEVLAQVARESNTYRL